MRMFQSVSRPTVSQLKGVCDTISNWFANHRPRGTQISTVTNTPFRSKLESNGFQVDRNHKFSERIFQLLSYSGQHPSFSAHWADLMTKTDLTFPAFSLRIVDFAVQFLLRCKFSFHEKQHTRVKFDSGVICLNQSQFFANAQQPMGLLHWFCIGHRWRQMAFFFVFVKMGKAPLSPALREIKQLLCAKSLILYCIKQIDSMLPCICPVIDHRGSQNVVRTSVTHSAVASCATFLFLQHFDVICDLLLDRCTAAWNVFVK